MTKRYEQNEKHVEDSSMEGRLITAEEATAYITAGNATFTLRSTRTSSRFTYKVTKKKDEAVFFAMVLNGPDNTESYGFIGVLQKDKLVYATRKSRVARTAPSFKALEWAWAHLIKGDLPDTLEVWHSSRCGRCGRLLTVPSSVGSGFGPECITMIGGIR